MKNNNGNMRAQNEYGAIEITQHHAVGEGNTLTIALVDGGNLLVRQQLRCKIST